MNVFIIGDSTTKSYDDKAYPQQGSGYYIAKQFAEGVNVINCSEGGYSLKSFIYSQDYISGVSNVNEMCKSKWSYILNDVKQDDYVIFCWAGINDMLNINSDEYRKSKCGSYVRDLNNTVKETYLYIGDGLGDYEFFTITSTLSEYSSILKNMINDVKSKGASPLIVKTTGKYYCVNKNDKHVVSVVRKYSEELKEIAITTNTDFIDVGSVFERGFFTMGYNKMLEMYFLSLKAYENFGKTRRVLTKPVIDDNCHYNLCGAKKISEIFVNELKLSRCDLKKYLK